MTDAAIDPVQVGREAYAKEHDAAGNTAMAADIRAGIMDSSLGTHAYIAGAREMLARMGGAEAIRREAIEEIRQRIAARRGNIRGTTDFAAGEASFGRAVLDELDALAAKGGQNG